MDKSFFIIVPPLDFIYLYCITKVFKKIVPRGTDIIKFFVFLLDFAISKLYNWAMDNKTILKNHQKFNNIPLHIERFSPDETIHLHYHDCAELVLCTKGEVLNHIEDICLHLEKGSLFVIGGHQTHSMSGFKNFEGYRILFDISLLDALNDEIKNTLGYTSMFLLNNSGYINFSYRCCMSVEDKYYSRLVSLLEDLLCEYESETMFNESYISFLFCTICILIIKCFEAKQQPPTKILFDKAVAELIKHLNENIDFAEIAKTFGISARYFRKIFTEESGGMSPSFFITALRLRRAKSMLSCSNKSITEIAFSCGFYDSSHMTRCFNKFEGITPKEYRKRTRK